MKLYQIRDCLKEECNREKRERHCRDYFRSACRRYLLCVLQAKEKLIFLNFSKVLKSGINSWHLLSVNESGRAQNADPAAYKK